MFLYNACIAFNESEKGTLSPKCHAVGTSILAVDAGVDQE
jgi:hypothetical protein